MSTSIQRRQIAHRRLMSALLAVADGADGSTIHTSFAAARVARDLGCCASAARRLLGDLVTEGHLITSIASGRGHVSLTATGETLADLTRRYRKAAA